MQHILIVEDDLDIQDLLRNFLQEVGYEITIASDGMEAIALFSSAHFDLILLDIMLPKIDGFTVCELIRKQSQVPIIMLTALNGEEEQIRGLDLQVDDYITKPFSLMVLVSKVQAFMRRVEGVCGHNRILSGNIEVNYGEMRALKRNADGVTPLTLSKKELQIMIYFMENARQILSKEQILEYVWDVDGQFVDDNTVPVNISRLKGKIGNDYIQNVRGMGYIWTEESVQE